MKKYTLTIFFALISIIVTGTTAANAQSSFGYRATIPFDFDAGSVSLEAGEYVVGPLNRDSGIKVLAIRNRKTGNSKILGNAQGTARNDREVATLTFLRDRGHYTLLEVKSPDWEKTFKKGKVKTVEVSGGTADREIVLVKLIKH
ncbi:MAG: hypothetical protein WBD22_14880 [Pyrinomonadaceae bacterium]